MDIGALQDEESGEVCSSKLASQHERSDLACCRLGQLRLLVQVRAVPAQESKRNSRLAAEAVAVAVAAMR